MPRARWDPISSRLGLDGPDGDGGELAALFAFEATCIRGRRRLGDGDAVVGEWLPTYLDELGADAVRVWTNDTCAPLRPPYADPAMRLHADALRRWAGQGVSSFGDRERTHAYYLAGGGDEAAFEVLWERALASMRGVVDRIDEGTYHTAGGFMMYLVAGRKPGG